MVTGILLRQTFPLTGVKLCAAQMTFCDFTHEYATSQRKRPASLRTTKSLGYVSADRTLAFADVHCGEDEGEALV